MVEFDLKLVIQIVLVAAVIIDNRITIKFLREIVAELKQLVTKQGEEIVKLKIKTGVE